MAKGLGFVDQPQGTSPVNPDGNPNVTTRRGGRAAMQKRPKYRPQKSMFTWTQRNVGKSYALGDPLWTERRNEEKNNPAYTDYIER